MYGAQDTTSQAFAFADRLKGDWHGRHYGG